MSEMRCADVQMAREVMFSAPFDDEIGPVDEALSRIDMEGLAARIFEAAPVLQEVCKRLADHISDVIVSPLSGRPVIDACLEQALTAYYDMPHGNQAARFVQALINRATDVTCVDVSNGREHWDVLEAIGVVDFLKANPDAVIVHKDRECRRPNPAAVRRHLGRIILTRTDLLALDVSVDDIVLPPE